MLSVGFFLVVVCVCGTSAYPNGASSTGKYMFDSMCTTGNLRPHHGKNGGADPPLFFPQVGTPPFTLTVTSSRHGYNPGDNLTVTLSSTSRRRFRGFFITVDSEDAAMGMNKGQFFSNNSLAKPSKFCVDGITHTGPIPKAGVTVFYAAPKDFTHGTLQFKATVVINKAIFFTGILSPPVHANASATTQTSHSAQTFKNGGSLSSLFNARGPGGMDMSQLMKNVMNNMGSAMGGGMGGMPGMGGMGGMGGMPGMGGGGGGMPMNMRGMPSFGQG